MKTKICIVGGGPAGLMLSQILDTNGIENIILERQTMHYVQQRIRAGVLESGTIDMLRDYGLGERMDKEGHLHDGVAIAWQGYDRFLIDTKKYTGKPMMAYGQTAITQDLYEKRLAAGAHIVEEAANVQPHDLETGTPYVTYEKNGATHRVDCDFVVGCDGFHGVCRQSIPKNVLKTFERVYPFGWLGIMSETPPLDDVIYACHERGFALASQRNPMLSRYYVQVPNDDKIDDWSDDRFWEELKARFPKEIADKIVTGPSIEKSIAPLRSFVAEPMRFGSLFLAGDSAHIVPPTGAKGLNLAFSDVFYLTRALEWHYLKNDDTYMESYSEMALRRVWGAVRLSWWLTQLMHQFPDDTPFAKRIRDNEYERLFNSEIAQKNLADEYVGLSFEG